MYGIDNLCLIKIWKGNINFSNSKIGLGDLILDNISIPRYSLAVFAFTNYNASSTSYILGTSAFSTDINYFYGNINDGYGNLENVKIVLEYNFHNKKLYMSKKSSPDSLRFHILNISYIGLAS